MCLYFRNKSIPVFFPFALFQRKRTGTMHSDEKNVMQFLSLAFWGARLQPSSAQGFYLYPVCIFVPWKKIYPLHFYTSSSDIWTHILMSDLEISIRQKLVKLWDTLTQMYLKFSRCWYTFIGKHSIFLPLSFTNADANLGTIFEMYSCQGWMCDDKSGVGWGL